MGAAAQQNWPEVIAIPTGFEPEGIELGKGHDFFVGAFSYSSAFLGAPTVSNFAGAIYKGNLRTGEGTILAEPTGKLVSGLSYDPRTDYLYAAKAAGDLTDQGVIVYDASSGELITEITFGEGIGIAINDVLVTRPYDPAGPTIMFSGLTSACTIPSAWMRSSASSAWTYRSSNWPRG